MIYTLLVFIISIICVLLTIAVLLQSGQGEGLSGIAAGGAATQMMGQRRAADFLSKATTFLGTAFLVLCIVANFFIQRGGQTTSAIQQAGANAEAPLNNNINQPSKSPSAIPAQNGKTNTPATGGSKTPSNQKTPAKTPAKPPAH